MSNNRDNIEVIGFDGCKVGKGLVNGLSMVGVRGHSDDDRPSDIKLAFARRTEFDDIQGLENVEMHGKQKSSRAFQQEYQQENHQEVVTPLNRQNRDAQNSPAGSKNSNKAEQENFMSKFKMIKDIGSGGFGTVRLYRDTIDQQQYAIKKVPITENINPEEYLKEVRLFSKLKSDRVVDYRTSWVQNDPFGQKCLYIQMAYYEKNLSDYLSVKIDLFDRTQGFIASILEYFASSKLFVQIVESVDFLHNQEPPIIHRDLKPANIMLDLVSSSGNFVRLCDFGLAKLHDEHVKHTRVVGTAKYMAPEVANGQAYDWRCDIYSLGLIGNDLFGCDHNDWNEIGAIKAKWHKLKSVIKDGTEESSRKRPSCKQILSMQKEWSVDKETVESMSSYTHWLSMQTVDNLFLNILKY